MTYDAVIVGAGAAGLFCAIRAGKRGRSVLVIEHQREVGKKIRISGGRRCNFTNINARYDNYLSDNPDFCRSALSRYTPNDFIKFVKEHRISFHEKKDGQLFCDGSSQDIADLLLQECKHAGVIIWTGRKINKVSKSDQFVLELAGESIRTNALVIATGGLSIPSLGASGFGYLIARQFGLNIIPCRPGLVPLILKESERKYSAALSGVSMPVEVCCGKIKFQDDLLFTHRGLSGPAILQISSYWNDENSIDIDLFPASNLEKLLWERKMSGQNICSVFAEFFPKGFAKLWCEKKQLKKRMNDLTKKEIAEIAASLHCWRIVPARSEGYSKAEVTVGGIDTNELSPRSMESKKIKGLFFIGEVLDVTGWLGGYNFQWAWSSGYAAGNFL